MATKKQKPQKKVIKVDHEDFRPYELDGKLKDLLISVEQLIIEYGPEARIDYNEDYWPQYNDSPSPRFFVTTEREETDDEYKERVSKEAAQNKQIEERERAELKRLQTKYKQGAK